MVQFWFFFIAATSLIFILGGIILYLRRFGKAPHIPYLITYLACSMVWMLTCVMEVVTQKEFWLRFWGGMGTTLGIFTFFFMMIFIFFYLDHQIERWVRNFFMATALLFSIARWTNPIHHLFYTNLTIRQMGSFFVLEREYGTIYLLLIGISAIILLFALFKIFQYRLLTHQIFRRQITLFAYLSILLIVYNLFGALNISLSPLPIFPIFMLLPGLGFTLSAFHGNNINLIPLPRGDLLDVLNDAMVTISPDGIILDINREMSNIVGKEWSRAAGNPLLAVFPDLASRVETMINSGNGTDSTSRPYKYRFLFRTAGRQFDTAIYDRFSNYLIVLHDITPLMRSLNSTNLLALNDSLTGIQNRRSIEATVQQWLNQHQDTDNPFCFILFDIDHFKQFNDTYGHQVGDEVLKQLSNIFTRSIRATDLFGRFGGDEFILFLDNVTEEQARMVLDRGVKTLADEHLQLESGIILSPTISVGAVYFTSAGEYSYEEIFTLTDAALYTAKEHGRNQICFRKHSGLVYDESLY